MARYWDGHAWVDVDQVVEGQPDPSQPEQRPLAAGPRLVAQRRSSEDSAPPAAADAVDEVRAEQLDVSPSPSEPESRKD
jgi:hypothetical protein